MKIIKASGERETYSRQKLCRSLKASGASRALVDKVCRNVEKTIRPGTTTQEIHEKSVQHLARESTALAARYSLRKGIMELGPAGFLFEQYIAAILREYGYTVKTNQMMKGESGVLHEIDVLAFAKNTHYIIEAKYHNSRGVKTDVKVAMYTFARLLDIKERQKKQNKKRHQAWLATNTKFTKSAIQYARYKGIKLTGWKYPKKESLENLIETKSLYPVTVLPSMNRYTKEQLSRHRVFFAKDLIRFTPSQLQTRFGIQQRIGKNIQREAISLCE